MRLYYTTLFNIASGTATSDQVLNLFEQKCRDQVKVDDVAAGMKVAQGTAPKMKGAKVEDLDFGNNLVVNKTAGGAAVVVPASEGLSHAC